VCMGRCACVGELVVLCFRQRAVVGVIRSAPHARWKSAYAGVSRREFKIRRRAQLACVGVSPREAA